MAKDANIHQLYKEHQGKLSDKWSLYLEEWDRLLLPYHELPISLLEIGVQNGGSLEIWSKYFQKAEKIIGCDIDPTCKGMNFDDPRITVVVGNANSDDCEQQIFRKASMFDLIIDDGSHKSSDIIRSFVRYFSHLNEEGIYIVEDLHCSYWKDFEGGLNNPLSAMAFFKRLADVVNYEHWRNNKSRSSFLNEFTENFGIQIDQFELAGIHSIEFINSLCIIKKLSPKKNVLGPRIVNGMDEIVTRGAKRLNGTAIHDIPVFIDNDEGLDVFELIRKVQESEGQKEKIETLTTQLVEQKQKNETLTAQLAGQMQKTEYIMAQLSEREQQALSLQAQSVEYKQQVQSLRVKLVESEQGISVLNIQKTRLEQELANLNNYINQREQILQDLNSKLLEIYSSTAWKLIQGMWKVRLWLAPKGGGREKFGRSLISITRKSLMFLRSSFPSDLRVREDGDERLHQHTNIEENLSLAKATDAKIEDVNNTINNVVLEIDYLDFRHPWRKQVTTKFLSYAKSHYAHIDNISHVILLPLFSFGGAELVAVNFINSIIQTNKNNNILLIVSDINIVDHNFEIPANVIVLNLEEFLNTNDTWKKRLFVYDLINMIKPSIIHNINSSTMWELIIDKGSELRNFSKLYANIFCFQFNSDGSKIGYAESYLRQAIPYLDGLISDNRRFIDDAVIEYKLQNESNKFQTIYTPARSISENDADIVLQRLNNYGSRVRQAKRLRCIWAGRLDEQKRWDLFLSLVKSCSFCDFDMYGKSIMDEDPDLPSIHNLKFCGSFSSSKDVFLNNDYDVFVFTSQWEGLPTILLDAGIYGVPIVAPSVGGVGELVTNETGFLLGERPTVENYLDALTRIKNEPDEAVRRAKNMIEMINRRHSWSSFIQHVKNLDGYLE